MLLSLPAHKINVTTHTLQHSVRKQNQKPDFRLTLLDVTANKITQPILNAGCTIEFINDYYNCELSHHNQIKL
jgi:hypothetical protein